MAIVDDDIERVKAAIDIADVIGQHTQLERVGNRMQGLCPFRSHDDRRTRSTTSRRMRAQ